MTGSSPSPGAEAHVGLIGGSFDPIHVGHTSIARVVRERLGLSRMVFVPAGEPPHKLDKRLAEPKHRLEMVRLAIARWPQLAVSRMDLDRPGPCFSVDTVRLFRDALSRGVSPKDRGDVITARQLFEFADGQIQPLNYQALQDRAAGKESALVPSPIFDAIQDLQIATRPKRS